MKNTLGEPKEGGKNQFPIKKGGENQVGSATEKVSNRLITCLNISNMGDTKNIMKDILKENYAKSEGVKNQPGHWNTYLKEKYEKILNGEIEYHSYLDESPIIYSYKDNYFYLIKNGKFIEGRNDYPPNDLYTYREKEKFYQIFKNEGIDIELMFKNNPLGIDVESIFKNKADIENQLEMILRPESLEKWFLECINSFNEDDKKLILKAFALSKEKHTGQYRKEGTEYYTHPVFASIKGIEFKQKAEDIIVLLLHDTLEDTHLTYEEICDNFGENVAKKVQALSKKEHGKRIMTEKEYYKNISEDKELIPLKGFDRLANLYSLSFLSDDEKIKYITDTKKNILPLISKNSQELTQEFLKIIEYIENKEFRFPYEIEFKLEDLKKNKK